MRVLLLIAILAACESGPKKPASPPSAGSDVPATGSTAPKFDAAVAKTGGPRTPPKVDDSCVGGCTLTDVELAGDQACCPGCSQTAVNATSYKAFQDWCTTSPPSQCPPLGCAMPIMRAECEAGHCVAKDARAIVKP